MRAAAAPVIQSRLAVHLGPLFSERVIRDPSAPWSSVIFLRHVDTTFCSSSFQRRQHIPIPKTFGDFVAIL
jgi:hypothetical protein